MWTTHPLKTSLQLFVKVPNYIELGGRMPDLNNINACYWYSGDGNFCVYERHNSLPVNDNPLLGWVSLEAQPGDEVLLIHGFSFPMVVREINENKHRFVGICFLTELMDGEAMEYNIPDKYVFVC
jgi:hypothetical protein